MPYARTTQVEARSSPAKLAKRAWLAVGGLTLIGLALRIYHLNHSSLWMDEVLIMSRADPARSWKDFFEFTGLLPHPVWHHGAVKIWLTLFGYTEFNGRFFSVVFGTLCIPATYLLARNFAGVRGSLVAALVVTVSYYMIFYAQEVTVYAHWYALMCISHVAFIAYCRKSTLWRGAAYAIVTTIALHTHFMSAYMIVGQAAAALYLGLARGGLHGAWIMALRFLGPALAVVISLVPMVETIRLGATMPQFITSTPAGTFPLEYFYNFFGDSIVLAALAAVPIAVVAFGKVYRWALDTPASSGDGAFSIDSNTGASLVLIMLIAGLTAHYFVSLTIKPMLFHRYTIYTLPLYVVLLAIGFDMIKSATKQFALSVSIVALSLWVLVVVKDQYSVKIKFDQPRELVRYVAEKTAELRPVRVRYLVNDPNLVHYYMYANRISSPLVKFVDRNDLPEKIGVVTSGDQFWIIVDGWKPAPALMKFLEERYEKIAERHFSRGYAGLFLVR